jgi:hypothetical protein
MKKLNRKLITILKHNRKTMDEKFEIVTIVQLKSGSFNMTVQEIGSYDKCVSNELIYR